MKDENGLIVNESYYLEALKRQYETGVKLCSRMDELTELVKMKQEEYNEIESVRAEFDRKKIEELEKEVIYLRACLKDARKENSELRSKLAKVRKI